MLFARRVKLPDVIPVQRAHDADPGEHRWLPNQRRAAHLAANRERPSTGPANPTGNLAGSESARP
jgi:hypothetical protein